MILSGEAWGVGGTPRAFERSPVKPLWLFPVVVVAVALGAFVALRADVPLLAVLGAASLVSVYGVFRWVRSGFG